jgi:hypothetical protein
MASFVRPNFAPWLVICIRLNPIGAEADRAEAPGFDSDAPSDNIRLREEWRYASPAADLPRSIRGRTIKAPP